MKLRNKLAAIAAATMLAFTGVGFAAWTFTNTVTVADPAEGAGKVTCAIEADSVTLNEDNLYLVFDAPTVATVTRAAGHGIYWTTDITDEATAYSNKVEALTLTGVFNHEANQVEGHDVSYAFAATPSLDNLLVTNATYVTQVAAGSFTSGETGHTNGTANVSATYTLPTFDYTALVKGYSAISEMSAMVTALSAVSVSISFSFSITGNYTA